MKLLFNIGILFTLTLSACSNKSSDLQLANSVNIDGTQYPTVVIGNQTWTSVNYNGPGGVNFNDSGTNDPIYGKLYTYAEAEAIRLPNGWRVPTKDDCLQLLVHLGAKDYNGIYDLPDTSTVKLMSRTTWNGAVGTNLSGFNAVGAGVWWTSSPTITGYASRYSDCEILTSSLFDNGEHMSMEINDNATIHSWLNDLLPKPTDRGSLRFVKDN